MTLQEALKNLGSSRVKKGDSPESACRSDRMNAIMDAIAALARGDNIGRGINIRKRTGDGMVILSGMPGGAAGAGQNDPDLSFFLSDASTIEDEVETNKIFVNPGKINDELPTGMSFDEDYIIDVADPDGSFLIAIMTFDPDIWEGGTEGVLSRDLQVIGPGDEYPEEGITDGVGRKIQQLAFMYFDSDEDWRLHQTYIGDIDFLPDGIDSRYLFSDS